MRSTAPPPRRRSRAFSAGACLSGVAALFGIDFCVHVTTGGGWSAFTFTYFIAPFLILLPVALLAVPSWILFKRRRSRLDLASLLLSLASVLVTIIGLVVLFSVDFRGC